MSKMKNDRNPVSATSLAGLILSMCIPLVALAATDGDVRAGVCVGIMAQFVGTSVAKWAGRQ